MIFGIFEKAFVINLDHRTDRMNAVSKHLSNLNIPFERFPGIKPKSLNGFTNIGFHGATISHCLLWKKITQSNAKYALIFEDDALLRDDIHEHMNQISPQLETLNWDVFYLGYRIRGEQKPISKQIWELDTPLHFHAYAVRNDSIHKLIEITDNEMKQPQKKVADWIICTNKKIVKLGANPILAIQRISPSDTGGAHDRSNEYFHKFSRQDFESHCSSTHNPISAQSKLNLPSRRNP
jgi:GR25 family glycosyltransferase involved in LPS biosynthesis